MRDPTVHILLTTYNREHLILETLRTISEQSYQNFKCFIIDDRSDDDTAKVVSHFCKGDNRFTFYVKPPHYQQGLPDSRNYSLELAREDGATHVQLFDDDDLMHPQKVELQIRALNEYPEIDICCCNYESFDGDAFPLIKPIINPPFTIEDRLGFKMIWRQQIINSLQPIFKIELFDDLEFTNHLAVGEERELYLKMFFKYDLSAVWVHAPLFYYRKHTVSNTAARYDAKDKEESNQIIYRNLYDYYEKEHLLNDDLISFLGHYFLQQDKEAPQLKRLKSYVKARKDHSFKDGLFWLFLRSNTNLRKLLLKILIRNR